MKNPTQDLTYLLRAVAVWLLIVCAESLHGVLRQMFLAPLVGDFEARQLSVFTGSLLILAIAYLFVRWIRAGTTISLLLVGFVWLAFTVAFELVLGRYVLGLSWERLASDYRIERGGLMPFGLIALTLSPLIADRLRGLKTRENKQRLAGASGQRS
jgi:hypothetical protein